ncbi:hypothetical protein CEUSTIGMA_g10913.t1 [Chlamydomonas eustigma]|uniref:GATA-type domain-containing protein n=1 Tax=Chlamydomonas eustigma TaxID=1157962 RepID=A0A250XK92_9CHLO|nr:hypothetical protein CEUSTIGMA_g10913.t1 [Chlamydomonas eustigma]|eukprot:GAX83488.1 hypothetical protein CEUSTIGMA_g10913.t1 [Chlamydomonas eustigma]
MMAKAVQHSLVSLERSWKVSPEHSDALTYALLETVRLVLEDRQDADNAEDPPDRDEAIEQQSTSSEHTSSESYPLQIHQRKKNTPVKNAALPGGPCAHCGALESPQWRRPLAKKIVLCNACGIYYSRHHTLPKRKKALSTKGHIEPSTHEEDMRDEGMGESEDEDHPIASSPGEVATNTVEMHCDETLTHPSSFLTGLSPLRFTSAGLQASVTDLPSSTTCVSGSSTPVKRHPVIHRRRSSLSGQPPLSQQGTDIACSPPGSVPNSPGIKAPPTTPKKRADDQLDALFDSHHAEDSLAKRAVIRAATAAAGSPIAPHTGWTAGEAWKQLAAVGTHRSVITSPSTSFTHQQPQPLNGLMNPLRPLYQAQQLASLSMEAQKQVASGQQQPPKLSLFMETLLQKTIASAVPRVQRTPSILDAAPSGIIGLPPLQHSQSLPKPASLPEFSAESSSNHDQVAKILIPVCSSRGPRSRAASPLDS